MSQVTESPMKKISLEKVVLNMGIGKSGDVIVCGSSNTINGAVKLFRYPSLSGALPRQFIGHMSPVQDVTFVGQDEFVVSAGGNDTCVFVWEHKKE